MPRTKAEKMELLEQEDSQNNSVVKAKVRFIGNPHYRLVVIPDLKNDVSDGLTVQPREKLDLLDSYLPREINRSKGLRRLINGSNNPVTGEVILEKGTLIELSSLDDELPDSPKPFAADKAPGSVYHAERNFADDNLDALVRQEQKETERAMAASGGIKSPVPGK